MPCWTKCPCNSKEQTSENRQRSENRHGNTPSHLVSLTALPSDAVTVEDLEAEMQAVSQLKGEAQAQDGKDAAAAAAGAAAGDVEENVLDELTPDIEGDLECARCKKRVLSSSGVVYPGEVFVRTGSALCVFRLKEGKWLGVSAMTSHRSHSGTHVAMSVSSSVKD